MLRKTIFISLCIATSFLAFAGWQYPDIVSININSNDDLSITWINTGKFSPSMSGDVSYRIYCSPYTNILTANVDTLLNEYVPINGELITEFPGKTTSYLISNFKVDVSYYFAILSYDPTCSIKPYLKSKGKLNML